VKIETTWGLIMYSNNDDLALSLSSPSQGGLYNFHQWKE